MFFNYINKKKSKSIETLTFHHIPPLSTALPSLEKHTMTDVVIPTITKVNLTKDISTGDKFLNNYKLISKLGTGHNGKVYLGSNIEEENKLYAIKEISKVTKISILNKDPNEQLNKIQNEIDIMKTIIEHPKILKLNRVLNDSKFNKIFLILEYCSKGELKFGAAQIYQKSLLQSIIRDVVLGLEYLHGIGIIHRDIKPSNLLRNEENFVKISDFGISLNQRLHKDHNLRSFGTPAFLAPELCNATSSKLSGFTTGNGNGFTNSKIDGKIDIWALGITIYCLWYGKLPFNGKNEYELFQEIINNDIDYKNEGREDDEVLVSLLKRILVKDPKKRITIADLKEHPFLLEGLSPDHITQFQKFNEDYLDSRNKATSQLMSRTNSIQRRFKSIFRRKSSSASSSERPLFKLTPTTTTSNEISAMSPTIRTSPKEIPIIPITSSSSTSSITSSTKNNHTVLIPQSIQTQMSTPSTSTSPPRLSRPSMATSSNSLNLNSLLRSKKDVPNYLDDSTFFQSLDSDEDSDDDDDHDDHDSSDDSGDGLYNDNEDTLSFRIGPKRTSSSLQVKTVNEYLDI